MHPETSISGSHQSNQGAAPHTPESMVSKEETWEADKETERFLTSLAFSRMMDGVTQPLFKSRMNWIYNPAPPAPCRATVDYSDTPVQSSDTHVNSRDTPVQSSDTHVNSRDPPVLTSDTQASAIDISASLGAPLALPQPKKSRRRRRRRNRRSANENSAPRSAAPVTPDERWANRNSASQRATQHQSAASDPTQMMSTPVYKGQSIHSSHLTQPPIPATNRNAAFQFGLDRCRFPGLYKPAFPDPSQDSTANPSRVNNSGSGLSSPSLLQPCTKPFSLDGLLGPKRLVLHEKLGKQ